MHRQLCFRLDDADVTPWIEHKQITIIRNNEHIAAKSQCRLKHQFVRRIAPDLNSLFRHDEERGGLQVQKKSAPIFLCQPLAEFRSLQDVHQFAEGLRRDNCVG